MQKGVKVLLVEDDPFLVRMYQISFNKIGYLVLLARDGVEGLKKASTEKPDLVLLDILMPKMDGMEVLRRLKADPETSSIPVVLLTNLSDQPKLIEESKALGALDYIVKSKFTPMEVVSRISDILKK